MGQSIRVHRWFLAAFAVAVAVVFALMVAAEENFEKVRIEELSSSSAFSGTNVKIAAVPSNVVVLTSNSFNEVVLDETKDVFVEFSAAWCFFSNSVAPTYEKVAAAFKSEQDVVIARLEALDYLDLTNKYGVNGYPSFKFFPKGNKGGEDYEGGRNFDDFVSFINEKRRAVVMENHSLLTPKVGLVKELVSAGEEDKKAVFSKIEEAEKLKGSTAR